MRTRTAVAGALAVLLFSMRAEAQTTTAGRPDSAKLEHARHFLVLGGLGRATMSALSASFAQYRGMVPDLPTWAFDSLDARADRLLPTLVDSLVPEYASRFSDEELIELIRFYEGPVGKHFIAEQPRLVALGAEIGRNWATQLVAQFSKDLGIPDFRQ